MARPQNGTLCSHLDDSVEPYLITWESVHNKLSGEKWSQDILFLMIIMLSTKAKPTERERERERVCVCVRVARVCVSI